MTLRAPPRSRQSSVPGVRIVGVTLGDWSLGEGPVRPPTCEAPRRTKAQLSGFVTTDTCYFEVGRYSIAGKFCALKRRLMRCSVIRRLSWRG